MGTNGITARTSFNREGTTRWTVTTYVVAAAAAGAIDLAVLPVTWGTVTDEWATIAEAAALLRLEVPALPMVDGLGDSPLPNIAAIMSSPARGAYLAACAAVVALTLLYATRLLLSTRRRNDDGTYVGGQRAAGASVQGDARIVSAPTEVRRRTHGWRKGHAPDGGDVVAGELGGTVRLFDVIGGCAVLGQSGDGKSRRVAVESIVSSVLQGRSVVVNDMAGELERWTRPWVESLGTHETTAVRFGDPQASVRFDPLGRAKGALSSAGPGRATAELRELARSIVPKSLRGQDFFADGARNLFVGLALHVLASPEVPDDARNVSTILALVTPKDGRSSLERIADLQERVEPDSPEAPFLNGVGGDGGGGTGIVNTLMNYLVAYVDGEVAPMLADGEVDLERIGEVPSVVYVSSSSATGDRSALVNTFFSQTLSALRSCARRHVGSCPVRTILLEDEFAGMGRCERLLQDLGEIRKENIAVVAFWQSFHQLEAVSRYSREEAALLLDLCKTKLILSCGDLETCKTLSDSMGSYTARVTSESRSRSHGGSSTGSSDQLVRRPLISPSELMGWSARETGTLLLDGHEVMALPSRDVSETFVAPMLGMDSDEGMAHLGAAHERSLVPRDLPQPRVWTGPTAGKPEAGQANVAIDAPYAPEGFAGM